VKNIGLCILQLSLGALASCKGWEREQKQSTVFCKHGPYANYSTWVKTPSTDRSLVADQKAIVIRISQDSFSLYKPQTTDSCARGTRTWEEIKQENTIASAAFSSEKDFCEVKAINPAYLGQDEKTGWALSEDPFEAIRFFGLKRANYSRIDSIENPDNLLHLPPRVKSAEVTVVSTDECDTIEAVVRLIEKK
jgi:hypothetical protein